MTTPSKPKAPEGDLATFQRERVTHYGETRDVYRKGKGPAVLVLTEMPGISPQVLGFADRVVALGCSAVLPNLFGTAGRDPLQPSRLSAALYALSTMAKACVSKEFTVFATGRSSPVVDWLRALAASEHERCGGPGVGVVGMCFTGGFALAMAADARVLAPVMSQPSLPLGLNESRRRSVDCAPATLDAVAQRCDREGLRVIGLRFKGDPLVPEERFQFLRERLGDGFVAVELEQADGHPEGPLKKHHSVLTGALIDAPGEPTRAALDRVLQLFRDKLLAA
ncbi:dienelactone hydrolase family protein [Sorangium sp. So ce296]|uniref:dienelactone hydrolase family protein n=1 Tax=Sorangium sp. So ce296 TaxID=3133296 RepID=UPI003F5FE3A2